MEEGKSPSAHSSSSRELSSRWPLASGAVGWASATAVLIHAYVPDGVVPGSEPADVLRVFSKS